MTYREDFTLPAELMGRVSKQGSYIMPELIQVIINAAMQAERQQYLKVDPTNIAKNEKGMPKATSRGWSTPGSGTSPLRSRKRMKAGSTRKRWRRS